MPPWPLPSRKCGSEPSAMRSYTNESEARSRAATSLTVIKSGWAFSGQSFVLSIGAPFRENPRPPWRGQLAVGHLAHPFAHVLPFLTHALHEERVHDVVQP